MVPENTMEPFKMAPGSIIKTFKETFYEAIGLQLPSNPRTTWAEFGLDSLDALNLIHALETKFQARFTQDSQLKFSSTFCDIFSLLLHTLLEAKKITKNQADVEYQFFALTPDAQKESKKQKEQMVSIPKSLLDECIRAVANNAQLLSQLKQYQK